MNFLVAVIRQPSQETDAFSVHGSFVLTRLGRDYVDRATWEKEQRRYNAWARWVTLAIGLSEH